MQDKPTELQLELCKTIIDKKLPKLYILENGWRFIKKHSDDSYKTWKRTWDVLPLFTVDNQYVCCIDCGFGHDIVVDINKQLLHVASKGIFTDTFCFMSDYYGYPEGAFFKRSL